MKMIYDYRQEIINLMKNTQDTPQSLNQSMLALRLLVNIYFDKNNGLKPHQIAFPKPLTKASSSNSKLIKKNHDFDNLKNNQYRIVRLIAGCYAVDSTGQQVAYFDEKMTRKFKLHQHDIVTLSFNIKNAQYNIENVISDSRPSNIVQFGPTPIESGILGACIKEDINGKELATVNSARPILYISSVIQHNLNLHLGDTLLVAWPKNEPNNIRIRWVYPSNKKNKK